MDDSTDSTLQDIIPLSSDILKYYFFHMGGNVGYLYDLDKRTVTVEIASIWGKYIIEEGLIKLPI